MWRDFTSFLQLFMRVWRINIALSDIKDVATITVSFPFHPRITKAQASLANGRLVIPLGSHASLAD
jgi:hypothetical protein